MMLKIDPHALRPNELEVMYAISRVVSETIEPDQALDSIIKLARQVLIFDNVVLYFTQQPNELEPVFARAVGRGRSIPSDLSWGDIAAQEVIKNGKNFIHQAEPSPNTDRLDQHFFLGLPMLVGGKLMGALVFIRFGGPQYLEDQINLAEFIAVHISQLYERQRLVTRIANLEAERRLARLQDDFIAMISHELNTPLGFIKGYTTTLLRDDTQWDETTRDEFLTIIDEEADRLSELIENLLDSSRLQAGTLCMDLKPTLLDDLLNKSMGHLQNHYQNLNIQLKFEARQVTAKVDRKRLVQVLENLVSNAAKYAPDSEVTITLSTGEGQTVITVSDTGPGISPDHLKHIFERFYRVPERSAGVRGTGLGLFICHNIIEAHNGNITVESKINQGTTFSIYLPIFDKQASKEE
jgi:signal transduction histidine kinase